MGWNRNGQSVTDLVKGLKVKNNGASLFGQNLRGVASGGYHRVPSW